MTDESALLHAGTEATALAFADADGCLRWLRAQGLSNVPKHYDAILGQLKRLSEADFTPRERARIAEVLREPVMYLHTELARRYAGKPHPATDRELEATEQALSLWHGLWAQYSACLKPLLEGEPELQGVKAKLLHRGLWVGKQIVLVHGLARRPPPGSVWQEVHAYYRLAEMLECQVSAVSDELIPNAVGLSCYSMYSHALLLNLADPCSMTVRQIELTDRWLSLWARKIFPYAQQRETEGPVIVIDLDAPDGASLAQVAPRHGSDSMRFGYPAKLATSIRGRLKRLASGASPAELQLGPDPSAEQCVALLSHLDSRWYGSPRKGAGEAQASVDLCAGGLGAAYFRVAGRTFNSQDPLGRLSYHGAERLATLDALQEYDRSKDEAERSWTWERWQGSYDQEQATLRRVGTGQHRWHLEQLVVLNDGQRLRCGHVTRVAHDDRGELEISLKLWPGTPRALCARPMTSAIHEYPPVPALLLGATPGEAASLIAPPRTFGGGRMLRSMEAGPERRFRFMGLLQRGADFERVAFEEMPG